MKSAADLVQEHLLYMTTNLTQWRALYNENAVWEFAYASSAGLPGAARGIMEIAQRVEGFLANIATWLARKHSTDRYKQSGPD